VGLACFERARVRLGALVAAGNDTVLGAPAAHISFNWGEKKGGTWAGPRGGGKERKWAPPNKNNTIFYLFENFQIELN
jgi:hypothetical protein